MLLGTPHYVTHFTCDYGLVPSLQSSLCPQSHTTSQTGKSNQIYTFRRLLDLKGHLKVTILSTNWHKSTSPIKFNWHQCHLLIFLTKMVRELPTLNPPTSTTIWLISGQMTAWMCPTIQPQSTNQPGGYWLCCLNHAYKTCLSYEDKQDISLLHEQNPVPLIHSVFNYVGAR